jgi:hypothetical protein
MCATGRYQEGNPLLAQIASLIEQTGGDAGGGR